MNFLRRSMAIRNLLKALVVILLIACSASEVIAQKDSITKVFILRHAEKAEEASQDPSLSAAGKSRAINLAKLLEATPVDFIYSTPYKRTRETVGELSSKKNIAVRDYKPTDMEAVWSLVKTNKGKNLVFVGHSNTVPLILNALSKTSQFKNLPENEFDNIWILFMRGDELVDQLHLKY